MKTKPSKKEIARCREAAHIAIEKRNHADPTLQEIYGPVPPTLDNPHGYGLAKLERMKREKWEERE